MRWHSAASYNSPERQISSALGNPTSRGVGDMTGEYKNNPAEVGVKNADIVIDQLMQ